MARVTALSITLGRNWGGSALADVRLDTAGDYLTAVRSAVRSPLMSAPAIAAGFGGYYVAYLGAPDTTCCQYMLARICK